MQSTSAQILSEGDGVGERLLTVLSGALFGGCALGFVAPLERIFFHSSIYSGFFDMLLHVAWGIVTCSIGSLVAYTIFWCAFGPAVRKLTASVRGVLASVGGISGGLVGTMAYWVVLVPSKRWHLAGPGTGILLGVTIGGVAGATALPAFHFVLRRFPKTTLALTVVLLAAVIKIDLHRYIRTYGGVHLIVGFGQLMVVGFLGAQLSRTLGRSLLIWSAAGTVLLWFICIGLVSLSRPTPTGRSAVLQYGGIEKSIIRLGLWRMMDSDKDGFSRAPWGTDCNDDDPAISPLGIPPTSKYLGCKPAPLTSRTERYLGTTIPSSRIAKSVVWVVIDALRSDAATPALKQFPDFVSLREYRSCGSDTGNVFNQLFGARGCRPHWLEGSLTSELKNRGLALGYFRQRVLRPVQRPGDPYVELFDVFTSHYEGDGEREVLARAIVWIHEQEAKGKASFTLIHLWGGHSPYTGYGKSDWERYFEATKASLAAVSEFARTLSLEYSVIVMGDHGEEFGEHDSRDHAQTLYEEVLSPPLMVRTSTSLEKVRHCILGCPELLVLAYHLTTGARPLSALCEAKTDERLAFIDFPTLAHRGPLSAHLRSLHLSDGTKIIWDVNLDLWELYNLHNDPGERRNLAQSQPEVLERASSALFRKMAECNLNVPSTGH